MHSPGLHGDLLDGADSRAHFAHIRQLADQGRRRDESGSAFRRSGSLGTTRLVTAKGGRFVADVRGGLMKAIVSTWHGAQSSRMKSRLSRYVALSALVGWR